MLDFYNTIMVSNNLDPDQARRLSGLILFQTVCKGYQSADDKRRGKWTIVNLGTTTKLCQRHFVPKPHPGHVVVVSRPKIG